MLELLFEHKDFCVINKPPNSVVHKTPGAEKSLVLLQTLRDQLGKRIYPVHRLDNGTTGCLAFAFSPEAAARLQTAFQSSDSVKQYLALMRGCVPESGVFDRPLTSEKGVVQLAETQFQKKVQYKDVALVQLSLKTGRRHQIRRHASHATHHVVGDVKYGKGWLNRRFRETFGFYRMFLHCEKLAFQIEGVSETVVVHCPLDSELNGLLVKLQNQQAESTT